MRKIAITLLLAALSGGALAQQEDSVPEPEITIRDGGDRTIYEYRVNGILYAIKVEPENGKPYFLVDPDGNGNFIREDKRKLLIPEWVLFEW